MAGENAFADYKQFWGLATRYCKLACTFAGLVNLVGISAQSNISASRPRTVGWCRRRQIDEYDTLALSAVCYLSSPVGSPAGLFFGSPAKTGTPREACASRRDFASGFPWGQAGHRSMPSCFGAFKREATYAHTENTREGHGQSDGQTDCPNSHRENAAVGQNRHISIDPGKSLLGPFPTLEAMMAENYQYRITSRWCGWWGGWGSDDAIAHHIEQSSVVGWRLVRTESMTRWWLWIVPRPKVLFIFERTA